MLRRAAILVALLFSRESESASPVVLRMAGIAPEGTSWSRELLAFARDVEAQTDGAVRIKWYLGGIAGDEMQILERIKGKKLDGAAIAAATTEVAPSLRVMRVLGLLRSWDEAHAILQKLFPTVDGEATAMGLKVLGVAIVGSDALFVKTRPKSLADLKSMRMWVWTVERVANAHLSAIGIPTVATDLAQASAAFEAGKIDAYLALPTAALAYQWFVHTPHHIDMKASFLPGSLVIRREVFDSLPFEAQRALGAAGAKLGARFEDTSRTSQDQLMGGIFEKRGTSPAALPAGFLAGLMRSAHDARARIPAALLPPETIKRVEDWLREMRAR